MFLRATALTACAIAGLTVLPLAFLACGSNGAAPYKPPPLIALDGGSDGMPIVGDAGGGETSTGSHDGSVPQDAAPITPTTCPESFSLPDDGYTTVQLETDYDTWTTAIPARRWHARRWLRRF